MNQPSLSWVHHHLGVVKPYFPEYNTEMKKALEEDRIFKEKAAKEEEEKVKAELAKVEQQTATDAKKNPPRSTAKKPTSTHRPAGTIKGSQATLPSKSSSASPTPLYTTHPTDWRASLLPPWKGPENFTVPADFKTPASPHRWLPLPQGSVLDTTPIMATEYGAFTPALWHWTIAAQEHYSFLEHLERNELWRYKFHKWDYYYKRLGIQFIAIMGRDINLAKPLQQDDEAYFSETMPAKLKRREFLFAVQRDETLTPV